MRNVSTIELGYTQEPDEESLVIEEWSRVVENNTTQMNRGDWKQPPVRTNPSSVPANPWRLEWRQEVLPRVDLRNDIGSANQWPPPTKT